MVSGDADAEQDESVWVAGPMYFHGPRPSFQNGVRVLVFGPEKVHLGQANMERAILANADLRNTCLRGAYLKHSNLRNANLAGVDLTEACLIEANLSGAVLRGANLSGAVLDRAAAIRCDLEGATLRGAGLFGSNLSGSRLIGADLRQAEMQGANLADADLREATLTGCYVYGVSVWNTRLDGAVQSNLVISRDDEPEVQVDNLEVAQFVHLLLNNSRLRSIIDSITSKAVLILGRFTPERKIVLDCIREELRRLNYLPLLFDFEKPVNRDITETVSTLAHLSRFIIADITDARSVPQELSHIVPTLPSVPVQPILLSAQREYGMFEHFRRFPWVLEPFLYDDVDALVKGLVAHVVTPAEREAKRRTLRKTVDH